ncbi:MAG: SufS family cysteine desulfurase, partial [Bacteroidota bacterium]
MLDLATIRAQFPALQQQVHGKPLVYLDNAATTQKPQAVLDALLHYYTYDNANVHRGIHKLAERATVALERTRKAVQEFIHAADEAEIIFTAGATAGINLVATAYGQAHVQAGDEIIIGHAEHHANIVPWQMLCKARGAVLKVIPTNDTGELSLPAFEALLTARTKVVALHYVSNTLGTIQPIQEIIHKAHAQDAVVLVDAAQAAAHLPIDVQALDCDFLVFSAHKVYGPTGVGILYGKKDLLARMPPYQGGGEMIQEVTLERTTYNELPYKFEAGTPNIAGIVAFSAALHFIEQVGHENIRLHENKLLNFAYEQLRSLRAVRILGSGLHHNVGIISFVIQGVHHLDAGMLLDAQGIAVRTGHSCTQPLIARLGVEGVIRASIALYNTQEELA